MRRVACPGGEVEEEGHLCIDSSQVPEEIDGAVGKVGTQVVPILPGARRPDAVVVVVERGHELVRLSAVEPVPAVEPATQGPRDARGGHVGLVLRAQVPFPDGIGGVPVRPEDLGEEAILPGWPAPIPREADRQVGDATHTAAVVVPAREETGSSRRAQRRGVEVREPDSLGGHSVDHRSLDVGPVAAELCEAHVIENDQHDIGRAFRRSGDGRPPRLRCAPVVADPSAEHGLCHDEHPRDPRMPDESIAPTADGMWSTAEPVTFSFAPARTITRTQVLLLSYY